MCHVLRVVRVLWVLWVFFLYALLLPAVYVSPRVSVDYKGWRQLDDYYAEHRCAPPELLRYVVSPTAAGAEPGDALSPAVIREDGREFAVSRRAYLGPGDWVWEAEPSPLRFFPEHLGRDGRIVMLFFDPAAEKQSVIVSRAGTLSPAEVPTAEAERVMRENALEPYRLSIRRPRWLGMFFNLAVSVITILLFRPAAEMSRRRNWLRSVVIAGAVLPLLLLLFRAERWPMMILALELAAVVCGLTDIFTPAEPPSGTDPHHEGEPER